MNWSLLESIPGVVALPIVWRERLGQDFAAFKALCLQPSPRPVRWFPCPHGGGCAYEILQEPGAPLIGRCRTTPPLCADAKLSLDEITPLQLNWNRLGRALCHAFGLESKPGALPIPNTVQIGSWSADAIPAALTIQIERPGFHQAIAELSLRWQRPFLLFAPTSRHVDAAAQELLAHARAGFFTLDAHAVLTARSLQSRRVPGELFAAFTPQPKESDESSLQNALAVVQQLDTDRRWKAPGLLTVFRLYCTQELSAGQIARKYGVSKAAIIRRLNLIRLRTGADPQRLRRFSPHLARLETNLTDSRAGAIHRKAQVYGNEEDDFDAS